jgi:geranylgeranyl diphosphate synthase type II
MQNQKKEVEQALKMYLEELDAPEELKQAMEYSLMAGGKRLRPIFLLATVDALNGNLQQGIPAACALEMIHTYSLIHDDLPALDNDDYRRGKLTNHKMFGEALAILAGDALLTFAFDVLTRSDSLSPQQLVMMVRELSFRAGPAGMVGGQTADVLGEGKALDLDEIDYIHRHKTGDMLVCAVRLGCFIAGATPDQLDCLTRYAQEIGLAFQIQDDILDVVGESSKLGKAVGSDHKNRKNTYPSLLGLEKSREALREHVLKAKEALSESGVKTDYLLNLADLMIKREY